MKKLFATVSFAAALFVASLLVFGTGDLFTFAKDHAHLMRSWGILGSVLGFWLVVLEGWLLWRGITYLDTGVSGWAKALAGITCAASAILSFIVVLIALAAGTFEAFTAYLPIAIAYMVVGMWCARACFACQSAAADNA